MSTLPALTAPTMDVSAAAEVLGVSRASLYEAIKRGDAPVRTIRVGARIRVVTTSVVALLQGRDEAEVVRSRETATLPPRSGGTSDPGSSWVVK